MAKSKSKDKKMGFDKIKGRNAFRRTVSALTLAASLGLGGSTLASTLAGCENPLQDEVDSLKKEIEDKNARIEELQNNKTAIEEQIGTLELALESTEAQVASLNRQVSSINTQFDSVDNTPEALAAQKSALRSQLDNAGADKAAIQSQLDAVNGSISALQSQVGMFQGEKGDLQNQLGTASSTVISLQSQLDNANGSIALMVRQINLMEAGGKKRDAAWFAQFDAIVAHAQSIGSELATVFLGDGLIIEAVGGKTEAEIKTLMPNIPTNRVHVAAIDGATVDEIKYGINNGWLPQKTAYTVIHAGRAEVEEKETELVTDVGTEALAKSIGQKIGSIYPVLIDKTNGQAGNPTSVIFSGIIPTNTIHSNNIDYINGNGGIKKGDLGSAIDNNYIKIATGPSDVNGFKNLVNYVMNNQPTYVATTGQAH
jgi:peptidoglycan hydrolase CwlO-like protein